MPELPEVEVNRENLERWLRGRRIARAAVLDPKAAGGPGRRRLESALRGARLKAIERRAKYLVLDFGSRGRALVHLGMTGKFLLRERGKEPPAGSRVILEVEGGRRVTFQDVRRFGCFKLLDPEGEATLSRLGVDPLSKEFTPARLGELLSAARVPIKLFLMDQSRVGGLGNIQASEALYRAGIHPSRPASRLGKAEVKALHRAILRTLRDTLKKARGSEIAYVEEGEIENPFKVYGREGEPCPACRGPIRRMAQGGRSTFYCPRCQPR